MFQKSAIATLLIALFSFGSLAQTCQWEKGIISAESGLILRKSPGKGFIQSMPFGDTLEYCSDQTFGSMSYEDIQGFWRKVRYKGQVGYSFDGFIQGIDSEIDSLRKAVQTSIAKSDSLLSSSPVPRAHPFFLGSDFQFILETYNYCGDVSAINPSLYWYGIYLDNEQNPSGELDIKPVDLKIILSKEKFGKGLEFDILTNKEERSLFLIGSNKVIKHKEIRLPDVLKGIRMRGKRLFPGQELILHEQNQLRLSATGQILKTGPCPETKDYKITIKANRLGKDIEQDLAELIPDYGKCSIPELYWYGDLSGDGFPEIIFVSVGEEFNVFHLLQSNPSGTELFSVNSVFSLENCLSHEH